MRAAVVKIDNCPQNNQFMSEINKITLNFDMSDVIAAHPELSDLGIGSIATENATGLNDAEKAVTLYKGTRENGTLISVLSENRLPSSAGFEVGNSFSLFFENIDLEPNQEYTIYVYYTFYAAVLNKTNLSLRKETRLDIPYSEAYEIKIYGAISETKLLKAIDTSIHNNSILESISELSITFDSEVSIANTKAVEIFEQGISLCESNNIQIDEDKNTVLIQFDKISLYQNHTYKIILEEGYFIGDGDIKSEAIELTILGAEWKSLNIGRTTPRNENTVLSLSSVEIPIAFPDGYGFVNKSSTPLEYKGYLYVYDKSAEPLQELTFKINSAATGITSSLFIDLEPSMKYTIFVPKGQIRPMPFDNVENKYSDTSNGDIYLNFYTPAVETIPTVALVDDGKEFTASALEGKMRFDLVPFVFEDEQYRISKWGNWFVAELYEVDNPTPIATFDYEVINNNDKSYIEFIDEANVELLNGKEYELVFDARNMRANLGDFYEYTYNPRFAIKYKGETPTEHTLVIKSSDGHSMETVLPRHQSMTLKFTPSDNWAVTDVLHNEVSKGAVDVYTIDDLTENTTLEVQHSYQGNIAFEFTTDVNSIEVDGTNYVVSREGEMIVISGLNKTETIRVYSMGGQVLFAEPATDEIANITLPSGIYVITINDGTNEAAFKVKH